ncbi:uncharacterized protein LOC117171754 [Belonocnema kinseyi]|uniref:uncharacterized protein LOC117171754 n=1 Tax=Belonocnema kinseyi TaxID=2817044 RepID=UPI00143DDEE1|nr:uncharacterized protein LOC117171754 [Belonocnema kinseyi]
MKVSICPVMSNYYPNECSVCNARSPLKRCSRCNMISYCGREHQLGHWPVHKHICKAISTILAKKKINYIFENDSGLDAVKWRRVKSEIVREISMIIERPLSQFERQMFLYPRTCFVCHDTRQDRLKNCPRCPNASFCDKHPDSSIHNEDCPLIQDTHQLDLDMEKIILSLNLELLNRSIIQNTPIIKPKLKMMPRSIEEYFEYVKDGMKLSDVMKIYVAEFVGLPLTTCDVLQKLKLFSPSKLVVHLYGASELLNEVYRWEIILHLIPTLSQLSIIIFESKEVLKLQWKLCDKCHATKKKLVIKTISIPYMEFVKSKDFEEPELVLLSNTNPPSEKEYHQRTWKLNLMSLGMLKCPLAFLSDTEEMAKLIRESINDSFNEVLISYDGQNHFASPRFLRNWKNERICRENDRMLIFKVVHTCEPGNCNRCGVSCRTVNSKNSNCARCEADLLSKDVVLFPKQNVNRSRSFFSVNCCQVCHSILDLHANHKYVPCKKCKMIIYCDKDHQREHWPHHKELCKVICNMLDESGSSNLFEKAEKSDNQNWLQAKINLLLEAQTKLGRTLVDYEKEMFLFPKACFICHKSDAISLKTCKCALSFCNDHWDVLEHKKHCARLYTTLQCNIQFLDVRRSPAPIAAAEIMLASTRKETFKTISVINEGENFPKSMNAFTETCIKLGNKKVSEENHPEKIPLRELLYAEIFSRPLTLFNVLKKCNCSFKSMVIHVIGATDDEKSEGGYWEILLHFIPLLKNLQVIFVGPEVSELQLLEIDICEVCSKRGKKLEVGGFTGRYNEFFNNESFTVPNFVIGFNLHIHESDYGIMEDTWKDTILTLTKISVPFVMTAKTYLKALMDCKKLEASFGLPVDSNCLKLNEYRAVISSRDYETEIYEVTNQFVAMFFTLFPQSSPAGSEHLKSEDEASTENLDLELIPKIENFGRKAKIEENSEPKSSNENSEPKVEDSVESS